MLNELYYLQEITKMVATKGQEDKVSIPLALQGLDESSLRVNKFFFYHLIKKLDFTKIE